MRVVLADDQPEVRSALRLLLDQEPTLSVVDEAAETDALLTALEAQGADLVLLDWELPGFHLRGSMPILRKIAPDVLVVALSGRPEAREAALAAGANAFVSKGDPPERLLAALRTLKS